jgi:CzcA family heavy metal efflux pump
MVNNLIQWSLRNRLAVLLVSALLLVLGIRTAREMPVDVFPDLSAPTVSVVVEGHGMAPEEMETLVTLPIESAVNGARHVRRVRSATSVGLAVVWIEFEWGTEIQSARQTVTERLAGVAGDLPDGVERPVLAPISSIMGEILFISLTSDRHDGRTLRTTAKSRIRRRLLALPGVSQVTPIGGLEKQFQVVLDPNRLKAFDVSIDDVAEALQQANENVSAGFLIDAGGEYILRGIGRLKDVEDIGTTVINSRLERSVIVSDLGIVQVGSSIRRGTGSASSRNDEWEPVTQSGVIIAIQKQPGANTLALTEQLDIVLADLQSGLEEGMRINQGLFRQATFIEHSIDNTTGSLIEGSLMVLVVVMLFLASLRASAITLLAIPMSLVVAVLTLKFMGADINTMTLGGMAIAIGALVDDAIIDVENVVRRLRLNRTLPENERRGNLAVIYDASVEVRRSIVFATIIILIVFLPLFFLSGVEGRLLQPLGVAFCVSLAASLFTALTLTPALCSYLLPNSPSVAHGEDTRLVTWLKSLFRAPLALSLRSPWIVGLPALVLFVIAAVQFNRMGRNFLPEFNEGALVIGIVTLPGTSLDESDRLAHLVEVALMKHPEISAICRRTGRAEEDEHVLGVESSELEVTLDMEAAERLGLPKRSKDEVMAALRADLALIPGIQPTFGQPIGHRIDHMLSGTRANIAVKIFGPELPVLREVAEDIEAAIEDIPGVVDLSTEQQMDVPEVRVEFRRADLARHGVPLTHASHTLSAAQDGMQVAEILEGQNVYGLSLLLENQPGDKIKALGEIQIDTPAGYWVPMREIADIYEDSGPNMISRENVQRKIVVMCNASGRDMTSVVEDIQARIAEKVTLPPRYFVEYGGQFESAAATNKRLAWLGLGVILGIGFLLHVMFRTVRDTVLIMLNLPLAMIGGVLGVSLTGGIVSIASIIGFISVFGIAARNGIMIVSHVRHLQYVEGVSDFKEAVRRGSLERLAPILMTALASGLALLPLAMRGDEPGTEILSPMAVVILFGLLSATTLNMLLIPSLLLRFGELPKPPPGTTLIGQPDTGAAADAEGDWS